jgi:hypothetical protein
MGQSLDVRKRGEFGHQCVVGAYEPNLAESWNLSTYFGLGLDGNYLYGTFRDAEGHLFAVIRKAGQESSRGLFIQTDLDGGHLQLHPDSWKSMRGGPIEYSLTDKEILTQSRHGLPGEPFSYRQRVDGGEWDEGELLSLTGTAIGPGLQWYDPWIGGGGMYCSHLNRATGRILGRDVEGFYGYDQLYLPSGMTWNMGPYFNRIHIAWHAFMNEYEDGSFEVGQIGYGAEDWGFAMITTQDGPTVMTTKVEAEFVLDENGFAERCLYHFDGIEWEWIADPHGKMTMMGSGAGSGVGGRYYRGCDGRSHRRDDPRGFKVWSGWMETYGDSRHESA